MSNGFNGLEIAVIGMAGQFPGAKNINEYWDNIYYGRNNISFFTKEEMLADGADPLLVNHPDYVNAGGVLDDIDKFDASFFNYSPNEAKILNPQHRVFLECAWHALEDAAYRASNYPGSIGVFAGSSSNLYLYEHLLANKNIVSDFGSFQLSISNSKDQLATRVSHALNLTGPSINVQTACSTSLVAIHLACQSLLNGECTMALAGAVSIQIKQKIGYLYQEGMILSADGYCRAFDKNASGTVGGNGVGIVVLKRYADAVADGDRIDAIIKSSAINNDGNLKVGFTAPSIQRQADVIAEAINMAEISADTISYIETHGTGTRLGDPIEIAGLTQAFNRTTQNKRFCALGSVKPNIGHLDAAAGIAGFIKCILALKHKTIPKILNFTTPNPDIFFEDTPFYVNQQTQAWEPKTCIRRAGISAFGIGGTNAHLILEEAPIKRAAVNSAQNKSNLFCISAKSESALKKKERDLMEFLHNKSPKEYYDIAYTLLVGRESLPYKKAFMCSEDQELIPCSNMVLNDKTRSFSKFAFLFPGQGTQYINMGKELYLENETFRYWIQYCSDITSRYLEKPILSFLYPVDKSVENDQLNDTQYAQPALFIIEYALARFWMTCGIKPEIMIGHSLGEYVAATLAGVFSIEDALRVICIRATLMHRLPRGKMLAVSLSYAELLTMLDDNLSIAAVNSSNLCVISGLSESIDALQKSLLRKNIASKMLANSHAFHSSMMQPMLADFKKILESTRLNPPNIPYVSNVTGELITASEAISPEYWILHLRQTVFFEKGIQTLCQYADILLEVGPGRSVCNVTNNSINNKHLLCVPSLPSIRLALGTLWMHNVDIRLLNVIITNEKLANRVSLPVYPFERIRHWVSLAKPSMPVCEILPKKLVSTQKVATQIERDLIMIWESVLGVHNPDLNSIFFDLGGHSLLAIQLVAKINRQFNRDFATAWVHEYSTIKKQIELLKTINYAQKDYKPIVLLSIDKHKEPVFFIHPGHSGAEVYSELAYLLNNNVSLFALESYNLHSGQPFINSIQEIAQTYLLSIQTIAPKGPYYLGGWSLGGTIAFEIAQILLQKGEEVRSVCLIDSYVFDDDTQSYIERLEDFIDETVINDFPVAYQNKVLNTYRLEVDMLKRYRAKSYAGHLLLFNATRPLQTASGEQDGLHMMKQNGFGKYSLNMTEILVDADHYSIMQGCHLKKIAQQISESFIGRD